MALPDDSLNINAVEIADEVMGPGRLFAIWLQGCARHCPGCINEDCLPFVERTRMTPASLTASIPADATGICLTGGEPFAQAAPLACLCRQARRDRNLGVVCYTGYTLEELRQSGDQAWLDLLAQVDLLIDGPFLQEQAAPLPWRGSRNQTVHLLTSRYVAEETDRPPVMEIKVGAQSATALGIPNPGIVALLDALRDRGIRFDNHPQMEV